MTTTVYLVRHAAHDQISRALVGRDDSIALSDAGRRQVRVLADRFARIPIAGIRSSPQLRARQTAQSIAARCRLQLEIAPDLNEIEMGAWTGLSFEELQRDPLWHRWNRQRSLSRPPDGETICDVQERALDDLVRTCSMFYGRNVVLVSHAEIIRTLVLHYLARSPDDFATVTIDPASVTTLRFHTHALDMDVNGNWIEDVVTA